MAAETILQVPLANEYRDRIAADATRDDRTAARQASFLIKAFYDGRLVWAPGVIVATVQPAQEGGAE